MKPYTISLYKLFMFVVCCAATSIATANTVAIGWHSFRGVDTNGNSVTTDGTLATRVFTSNHIKGTITGAYNAWSTAANIVDTTYGDTGETFTPGDDSTGVTIDTFNTSADIVEITVINESGSSFTIDAIAFDAQATFGTGNLTVSHLSGSSELADDSTDRSLGAVALSDTSLVEQSIATTDMTDIELAVGETTAFRIQVSGSFMSVKLDNIAVMTSSTLVAPTPVTANTVVVGWNTFDGNTTTETVSEAMTGVSGTIVGGLLENDANNLDVMTYGSSSVSFTTESDLSTGIKATTNNNDQKRINLSVTNNSGADITLESIAFHAALTGNNKSILTVSHVSNQSDLDDVFNGRSLGTYGAGTDTPIPWGTNEGIEVSTLGMYDRVLGDGETATFRIELSSTDGTWSAIKLDNIAVLTYIAEPPVVADTVAIGWHSFDGDTATETASEASVGVSGTIVGGVEEIIGSNLDNQTYGDGVSFTAVTDSTGITANTFNNDNKRVVITVTNGTGSDLSIDTIALDAQLIFGSGSVTVSHLSGSSALADGFTNRLLDTLTIADSVYTAVQQSVATTAMDDVVLADGETAAFRIEVVAGDGVASLGVKLDNIAVMTSTEFAAPVADTVAIGWHSFDGDTATETASEASVGVSGTIVGGVEEIIGSNLDNQTYGDGVSFTAVTDSTGITANTFNNDNKRVVITVTNGTGSDLSIDTIALDAQLIFGSGSVTVSHLSGSSALADGFTNRLLDTLTIADSVYTAVQQSVATTAMDDVVLADGETAAFRIEVVAGDGVASLGVKLDNIAVMTSTEFAAPVADTVAIGWHSFDGDTATETASEASVGVSGTIVGGVEEIIGSNLDNQTYGDGVSFTAVTDSTGITANTFNNDNKRVVITVTNGTGSDLSIDTIALDAQLIFGSGSVTVSHLSGSSALADGFTNRLLDTLTIADSVYTAVQQSVATTAMDDVVLADGETAAFRIEVVAGDGVASLGVKLDNIAVMTSTELEEPPFDDNAVVLAAWTNFTIGKETRNDADGNQIVNGNGVPIQYSKLIDEAPDYTTSGVTASLGQSVQASQDTVGGGSEGTASSGDFSYGSAYAISAVNLDSANPTAITLTTFGANNWYVDFSITNNTGSDLQLSGIHFDAQTSWMADRVVDDNDTPDDTSDDVVIAEGTPHTVEVSHFNDVSDLTDTFNNRKIGTATTSVDFLQRGIGIDLSVLTDTLLADGESAAFRLKLVNPNGVNGGLRIDNLAITGTPAGTIRTLTVDTSAVEAGAGSVDLNGSRKYVDGETVSITATAAEGYTFTGWSGASDSTDATISVTLSADTTLTPNFAAAPTELPTLSISSDGTNVTLTWEGIATLKRADSLSGGFSEVTGAESPHTETVSGEKFYRLEQ